MVSMSYLCITVAASQIKLSSESIKKWKHFQFIPQIYPLYMHFFRRTAANPRPESIAGLKPFSYHSVLLFTTPLILKVYTCCMCAVGQKILKMMLWIQKVDSKTTDIQSAVSSVCTWSGGKLCSSWRILLLYWHCQWLRAQATQSAQLWGQSVTRLL